MSRVTRPSGMRASSPLPPLRINRPSGLLNTLRRNRSRKARRQPSPGVTAPVANGPLQGPVELTAVLVRHSSRLLANESYRLAPAGIPAFAPPASIFSLSAPSSSTRPLSSASASTFATRLSSSPESIRSTTVSQGLVAGMSETIATSFGSRRRFLMNQVRALSLLSLGRAELVGRGADLADAVEPCSRRPHGDGAPPRVDRQSGREDVLLPRARRAAHAVDALREPLYVAEPFPPRERVPLDAEHLRLHRCEEPPLRRGDVVGGSYDFDLFHACIVENNATMQAIRSEYTALFGGIRGH